MKIEKEHKKSALMGMKKEDLADLIITLEHNNNVLHDTIDQQVINFKGLLEEAQQDDAWIPVTSGELPENKVVVQITQKSGTVALGFCNRNSGDKWRTNDGYELFDKPIAWKPLPKPYDPLEAGIKRVLQREHDRISNK